MKILVLSIVMMCGSVFAYPNNFFEYDFNGNIAIFDLDVNSIPLDEYGDPISKTYYANQFSHASLHPTKANQTHAFEIESYYFETNNFLSYQTNNLSNIIRPVHRE